MRIVLGITGASGVIYGLSLAKALRAHELHIILSDSSKKLIEEEVGDTKRQIRELSKHARIHDDGSFDSPLASGSFVFDAMVICPCTMKTLSAIANGYSENLLCRAADVALKEHRKLILVPRETPINAIHIENMLKLSRLGTVILPASPAFYPKPKKISDVVDFIVGRILDQLNVTHKKYLGWKHV
ncbi:MAG: UbiX family flavin prenyltransferase [Candidatus Micrarchaeota archaeon]